ncbi:hypothetical protein FH972_019282 [Carpinus fangiana]|uniref:Uncharacterized protein n=1 Tax=Carpinus fangiana TaxID=176857 RepID=A0A5N6RRV6_9ROSI|nr:hypothetical protein FH972_019282 [Carpinus fangiana]
MMGEIDTKPIEPVQVALSLFGEKGDQRNSSPTSSNVYQLSNMTSLVWFVLSALKDLANYKVQLEAMDGACKQALLKLEHYQKRADEHFNLLRNTEIERDMFIDECREAKTQIRELDSKMKEMADQLLETPKIREQLAHVLSHYKAKLMEAAANMEKERTEELLRRVSELSEAFVKSRLAAVEAEKEKVALLSEKDAEIELAAAAAVQAQMQMEDMRKQNEMVEELENQLMDKTVLSDMLQLELKQANELLGSSEKSGSDAVNNLNQLRIDFEVNERKNLDQSIYVEALELELNQLKVELNSSNEEVGRLNCVVETLADELEKVKKEMDEIWGRDTEAQIEVALLKAELHKGKYKIAAAEAAEARANSSKSGLHLAVQQPAVEAQEAKKENQRKAEKADHIHVESGEDAGELTKVENNHDLENLKKELELAMVRVGEFRNRAEQAVSRAELAEKAKAAVEDHLRRSRQKQQRRKAAIAALQEESAPKEFNSPRFDKQPTVEMPLGKVLNMKFN